MPCIKACAPSPPISMASKALKRTSVAEGLWLLTLPLNTPSLPRVPAAMCRLTRDLGIEIPARLLAIRGQAFSLYSVLLACLGKGVFRCSSRAPLHVTMMRWTGLIFADLVLLSAVIGSQGSAHICLDHCHWHKIHRSLSINCPGNIPNRISL